MYNSLFNYLTLKRNIYLSKKELDSFRFNLLKKLLFYAYQNIPYYKISFDREKMNPSGLRSVNDISAYPFITKDIIRSNNFHSKALFMNKFKSHTSGSTGEPMWTYYDPLSWIRKKYIIKARARMECGLNPYEKIGIFESASQNPHDKSNFLFRTFKTQYKVFSIFEPYEETIHKLRAFKPAALYGAPSYLFQLAKFVAKDNLRFPSIKRIFTSSEYLQENVRDYIKQIFKSEVYDVYGSTEFKEVAWECEKHEGYHINEDEVIVEILKDGKPVPPGVTGNIVITDLRNKAMPLIRYQMYDKGILINEKCSCGRTFSLMKPYAGRSSEYVILPNGEIISPYLFTTSIEKIDGLHQYQVVQISENKISTSVVTNKEDFKRISVSIKHILSDITNYLMEIEVELKNKIDIEENGKFKVVKNLIK